VSASEPAVRPVTHVEDAWARHGHAAVRIGYLVTGDARRATRLSVACVRHALGTWRDLRGPEELDAYVLRHVIRRARRPSRRTPRPPGFGTWLSLGHRRRAALALVVGLGRDPAEASRILECSRATVDALVRKGLAEWDRRTGSLQGDRRARLAAWLQQASAEARVPGPAAPGLRAVALLRALSATCAVLVIAAAAAGAVAGSKRLAGWAPTAATTSSGFDPGPDGDAPVPTPEVGLRDSKRDWCPDPDNTLGFGRRPGAKAARVAMTFDAALIQNDWQTIAAFIDPSPLALGMRQRKWDTTAVARGLAVTYSASAADDEYALSFCGARVAARSWKVVMHDSNGVTYEGLAAFYLVRRSSGWKVWGSY
jgi:hypothetical protein